MCNCSRLLNVLLLVLASAALAFALFVSYLSSAQLELGRQLGLFKRFNTSLTWTERKDFEEITITPAPWAFSVWGLIYLFQIALLIYNWTFVFRRADANQPDRLSSCFLLWHFLSSLCNAGWILVADRVSFEKSLIVLLTCLIFGITICLYLALLSSYLALHREKERVLPVGMGVDYWLIIGLVQNGVSLYAGWVTVASFINVDIALVYLVGIDETTASIGCLAATMTVVLAYAIADLTVIDFATRFVFTPHLVVMWACVGSLARNFVAWSTTSIMTIVLGFCVAAALIVKLLLILIRSRRRPILRDGSYKKGQKKSRKVE